MQLSPFECNFRNYLLLYIVSCSSIKFCKCKLKNQALHCGPFLVLLRGRTLVSEDCLQSSRIVIHWIITSTLTVALLSHWLTMSSWEMLKLSLPSTYWLIVTDTTFITGAVSCSGTRFYRQTKLENINWDVGNLSMLWHEYKYKDNITLMFYNYLRIRNWFTVT